MRFTFSATNTQLMLKEKSEFNSQLTTYPTVLFNNPEKVVPRSKRENR